MIIMVILIRLRRISLKYRKKNKQQKFTQQERDMKAKNKTIRKMEKASFIILTVVVMMVNGVMT